MSRKFTRALVTTSLILTPSFIQMNSRNEQSNFDKFVQNTVAEDERKYAELKKELAYLERSMIGLANSTISKRYIGGTTVAIYYNGQLAFELNEGGFKNNTPFSLASVSKPITSYAILQLVEYEELKLTDTLNDILPELTKQFPDFDGKKITVKHLLQHTSGIPYIGTRPIAAPGTRFMYSNYNYKLLSLVIEKVSGQSFSSFIKENVFKPLEMNDSKVSANADGASGIMSSSRDLANFTSVFVNEGRFNDELVLTNSLIRRIFRLPTHVSRSDFMEYYGLGWRITASDSKVKHFYHKGIWDGIFADISIFPSSKSYVIQLANPPSYKATGFTSHQGQMSYLANKYIETLEKLPKGTDFILPSRNSIVEEEIADNK